MTFIMYLFKKIQIHFNKIFFDLMKFISILYLFKKHLFIQFYNMGTMKLYKINVFSLFLNSSLFSAIKFVEIQLGHFL